MITFSKLGQYGRLGNQLWQIASTIGIAIKNTQSFKFPYFQYSKYLPNVPIYEMENAIDKLPDFAVYQEETPYYKDLSLSVNYNWDLQGYFQSWKYFSHCDDMIRWYLQFPKLPLKGVAVHVRRGDYLSFQNIHPVLPIEYYKEAMKHFKNEEFTIFSDDIEWCKENITGKKISYFEPNGNDWLAFSWMASHQKFIIANSSYSFWAAYLSEKDSEIIAPKTWVLNETLDDRIPVEWKRL